MRSRDNEALVLAMWDDYEREGLPGVLRWAAEDAEWHPHSADGRVFRGTAGYREEVERALAAGVRVDSMRLGMWSHGDVVAVRGRLRVRRGGVLEDSRMYWVHRVREGRIDWTGSSPDLARLLEAAGLDRALAPEAFVAMHAGAG